LILKEFCDFHFGASMTPSIAWLSWPDASLTLPRWARGQGRADSAPKSEPRQVLPESIETSVGRVW
jgi:hypothetical protein